MALICFTQQARDVDPTPIQCWFNVYDTGQVLAERLVFAVYRAGIPYGRPTRDCIRYPGYWTVPFGQLGRGP